MKRNIIKSLFVGVLTTVTFTACNTDVDTNGIITEQNAIRSVADMRRAIEGVYSRYSVFDIMTVGSIGTDDINIGPDNGGQDVNTFRWIFTLESAQQIFRRKYLNISQANRLITLASSFTPGNSEQVEYNNILGEAYAFRALEHLDLLMHYAQDFNASSLAVPYIDYVNESDFPARNTVAEVAAKITADLDMVDTLLNVNADKVKISKDFVKAVRARLALTVGDNAAALNYANQLIAAYPLANRTQYASMFTANEDTTEVIWKRQYNEQASFTRNRLGFIWEFSPEQNGVVTGPKYQISTDLFNEFQALTNDVRTNVNINTTTTDDTGANWFNQGVYIQNKFRGANPNNLLGDAKVFRVSEMYLIRAEAAAKQNDFGTAAAAIKAIRDARVGAAQTAPTYSSVQQAAQDILKEARVEFALEGHRYVDVKRLKDIAGEGFSRDAADCAASGICGLTPSDHRFALPIPVTEIDNNPNMVQNTGY